MKVARFYEPYKLVLEDIDVPAIGENEMLLKVKATAVCGTDLRIYKFGHFKIPQGTKRVLGHEISGEIVQVGSAVKGYHRGMRVVVVPNIGCGTCAMCMKGQNQLCPDYDAFGISLDGGFQEYMRITEEAILRGNILSIPENLTYEEAALVEPFSCVYSSYRLLHIGPGDTVLIIGAGPIGACHVMMSKLAGASKIIVADISDSRLAQVKDFGVDVLINSAVEDLQTRVLEETDGVGMDVVVTANSVPEIQALSLELAASRGRICFFGGIPKEKEIVPLKTNLIHYKELQVVATTGSSISDFRQALHIAASGKISLKEIATGRFQLEDIHEAFEYAAAGTGMKACIVEGGGK
ncbi:MAG: zinc-dependent dehydrogenase [Oscillospiraceae bacterium]|nr:zinc-dependent dehydrogenase [Oscillospiraceae bacterium]